MSLLWWTVLICVLLVSSIGAGICLGKARDAGDVERLHKACADLEREIGATFLPIVEQTIKRISEWHRTPGAAQTPEDPTPHKEKAASSHGS